MLVGRDSLKTPCSLASALCLAGVLGACGANTQSGAGDGNGSGGPGGFRFDVPNGDAGLKPGVNRNGGPGLDPDEKVCGVQTIPLERSPAELLLVLDRSSSMIRDRLLGGDSNWTALTRAVDASIKKTEGGVLWGLKTFPTTSGCAVATGVEHDVAINNYGAISATVGRSAPGMNNGTPTTEAMKAAATYLKARTSANPKYLLLATDGEPTCLNGNGSVNATDIPAAIAAVADAEKAGFHTFVVGIAAQRQSGRALETLNNMALAGGEPRSGDTKFFSVTSELELTEALSAIAGQVGSCTFNLGKVPPAPDNVAVVVDDKRIAESPVDGWQYNRAQTAIVLNGPLCESARKGQLKSVKITFGCAGMVIL